MEKLGFGFSVALIGMLVVFAGLVLLIYCIKLITVLSNGRKAKPAEEAAALDAAAAPAAAAAPVSLQGVSPQVVAAITAAIAAVWQGDTGFVVRHVRRVHNAPAWNRAGREDQIYSRM